MSWNYRVVHRCFPVSTEDSEVEERWSIHEAYYDSAGRIWAITEHPVAPCGDSKKELELVILKQMARALTEPVLEWDEIPEEGAQAP